MSIHPQNKMSASKKRGDFIKTLDENAEIPGSPDTTDSEDDVKVKPSAKRLRNADFASNFNFFDNASEYNYDAWADVIKYIKRKNRSTLDEKIDKVRQERKKENLKNNPTHDDESEDENVGSDSEESQEESELEEQIPDEIKQKNVKKRKKNKKGPVKKSIEEEFVEKVDEETRKFFSDAPTLQEVLSFQEMKLSRPLLKAITSMNFVHPTPIQAATVPIALLGKDICGCAATGTGKTAAFMLPILERLLYKPKQAPMTRILVLTPTRELAVQIFQVTKRLSQHTAVDVGLAAGGLDLKVQESILRRSPDIVIATPGRLIDHLQNCPSFNLQNIEVLVLDEADRILDEYFADQLKEIIKQCSPTRQTMLFSATMTDKVKDLAMMSLKNPVKVFVNSNLSVSMNLRQEFVRIRPTKEGEREAIVTALVKRNFHSNTLVFLQTKKQSHRLHILLGLFGVRAGQLHSNLTQTQRLETLKKFSDGGLDILLCTDLAARGLDIPDVRTVINFTLPATLQHYIHRVGRTARAGRSGRAVSLAGDKERKVLKEIISRASNPVKSRIVPVDVISKYRQRIAAVEGDIEKVIREEKEEAELRKAESHVSKAKNMLEHPEPANGPRRTWFQTKDQIKKAKKNEHLEEFEKGKSKRKLKKEGKWNIRSTPEDRVDFELGKVAAFQARVAKRARRPQRMHVVEDGDNKRRHKGDQKAAKSKKPRKSFEHEFADTSDKSVRSFRNMRKDKNFQDSKRNGRPNTGRANTGRANTGRPNTGRANTGRATMRRRK